VIGLTGQPVERPDPKKPTTLRGVVGVWNCESSDYIRGRDGACYHAVRFLVRSGRLGHNQCHGLFHFLLRSPCSDCLFEACGDGFHPPGVTLFRKEKSPVKEQLESVVLQMYRAGVRCSEAVREFQKAFIVTVLRDQRGNQCKAAEKLGMHRNTLRRTIRELDIDVAPTRPVGRRQPPQSEGPMSVRRRANAP
jgi:Fis family transcriptional regulator, factor for inversion stimulation protein